MEITVVLCTYNRARLLRRTLESLAGIATSAEWSWSLLVIDNHSSDATPDVIHEFIGRLPLRSLVEQKPGIAAARNRGMDEATGDFIVWVDDDEIVPAHWLAAYARTFSNHPEASVFGGPIVPLFEGDGPAWLPTALSLFPFVFGHLEYGSGSGPLDDTRRYVFTGNCGYRLAVLRRYRFDPNLGRKGRSLVGGEDTNLLAKILRDGHKGWWDSEAGIQHIIPIERQTVGYLWRFFQGQGRQLALGATGGNAEKRILGRPRWAIRSFLENSLAFSWYRMSDRPEVWLPRLKRAAFALGLLKAGTGKAE